MSHSDHYSKYFILTKCLKDVTLLNFFEEARAAFFTKF